MVAVLSRRKTLSGKLEERVLAKLKKLHRLSDDQLSDLNTQVTISDLMLKLFAHYNVNGKHAYLRASQRRWIQHLQESFANLRASQLTPSHQQEYRAKRMAEGRLARL